MKHKERILIIMMMILIVLVSYYMIYNRKISSEGFSNKPTPCDMNPMPININGLNYKSGYSLMLLPLQLGSSKNNKCSLCSCTDKSLCEQGICRKFTTDGKEIEYPLFKTAMDCENHYKKDYTMCSLQYKKYPKNKGKIIEEKFYPTFDKNWNINNYEDRRFC